MIDFPPGVALADGAADTPTHSALSHREPFDADGAGDGGPDDELDDGLDDVGPVRRRSDDPDAGPRLDADHIARDMGPDGPIAAAFGRAGGEAGEGPPAAAEDAAEGHRSRYEDRESQRAMAVTIARLYNAGGIALLEAGTGVGKSLAYLLPALRWAAARGERTVVSTNTINLQEQLVGKDLPLLASALADQPVRFALLKGWRNYVCLHRLEHARGGGSALFDAEAEGELEAVAAWARETADGSVADLPAPPPRPEVWDEVAAEPDLCLRQRCPHFDGCFVFRARRAAAQADIVVVNHHLLMSDVAVRRVQQNWREAAVIPAYTRLVVDEGHHLEEAAAAHLGGTVTRRGWQRLFARLDRRGGKGLLARLSSTLAAMDDLLAAATVDLVRTNLLPAVSAVHDRGELAFDLLATLFRDSDEPQRRLTDAFAQHPIWPGGLGAALEDVLLGLTAIHDALRLIQERHGGDQLAEEPLARVLAELRGVARRLAGAAATLRDALAPAPDAGPMVRWLELRRTARERARDADRRRGITGADGRDGDSADLSAVNLAVCAVPLDLAPILREDLFKRVDTAVVTSATLATDGCFDFLASRLGVDTPDARASTRVFPSPFDYRRQALLAIPTDVPPPNVDAAGHGTALVTIVRDVTHAAGGGIFVLFTSHRDVRATAAALRADRRLAGPGELLVHGEDARDGLLRRFRAAGDAVLLGTASFWEGVDVPGRALRGLIIARLPFRVPTEPVTAAQCERIAADGGDPFGEFMVPQASLRLKQGFGRLIRSSTDRGVVVIADPRIATKPYGRALLASLPPARRIGAPWARLRSEIAAFYHADHGVS